MATEKKERQQERASEQWIEPLDTGQGMTFSELTRTIMRAPLRDIEAAERETQR